MIWGGGAAASRGAALRIFSARGARRAHLLLDQNEWFSVQACRWICCAVSAPCVQLDRYIYTSRPRVDRDGRLQVEEAVDFLAHLELVIQPPIGVGVVGSCTRVLYEGVREIGRDRGRKDEREGGRELQAQNVSGTWLAASRLLLKSLASSERIEPRPVPSEEVSSTSLPRRATQLATGARVNRFRSCLERRCFA